MERSPKDDRRRSRWGPPPDSDLIGIPLIVGIAVAVLLILVTLFLVGWVGLIVLLVILIVALAVSYRVLIDSETRG